MYIATLYGSSYTNSLLTAHADIKHEDMMVKVNLSEQDCEKIQAIVTKAYLRDRQKIVDALLNNTPALVALEAPKHDSNITDAEFFAVVEDASDDVPF